MEKELKTIYDTRKSFYNKARIIKENNKIILISYNTNVAYIDENNKPHVLGQYSQTTTRHIKEFLKQHGFKADNIKQIIKDYGENKIKK